MITQTTTSNDSNTNDNNVYETDRTDPEMPDLFLDSSDEDFDIDVDTNGNFQNCQFINGINYIHEDNDNSRQFNSNNNINSSNFSHEIYNDNNLVYEFDEPETGIFIGQSAEYPPDLDPTATAGACNANANVFTNTYIRDGQIDGNDFKVDDSNVIIVGGNDDPSIPCILFSFCDYQVSDDGNCILSNHGNVQYDDEYLEDIYFGANNVKIVKSKNI
ncbi:MAG: hypothetical protein ACPG2Y_01400, partial [Acholeplasmataceae bacterium]